MKDFIKTCDHIATVSGELVVTGFNGSIVDCEEYEINENDELIKIDDRRLTLNELGHIMKDLDGQNHTVIWENA